MAQKTLEAVIRLVGQQDAKSLDGLARRINEIGAACTEVSNSLGLIARPMADFGKKSLETFVDYESAMNEVKAVLGKDAAEMAGTWNDFAVKMGESTRYTALDFANAEVVAAKAGYSFEQMSEMMQTSYFYAMASNQDLNTSMEQLIRTTNILGLDSGDAADLLDKMAGVATSSATDLGELYEAINTLGGAATLFAGDADEVLALLGLMADRGTIGTTAGIGLRNMLIRLIAPTQKAADAMSGLEWSMEGFDAEIDEVDESKLEELGEFLEGKGFSAYDAQGRFKPIMQMFMELDKMLEWTEHGELSEESNGILTTMFPQRSISYATRLLSFAHEMNEGLETGGKNWAFYTGAVENSMGRGQQMAETMEGGIVGALHMLTAKWETFQLQVGEKLAPEVENIANWLGQITDKLNEMDSEELNNWVKFGEAIVGAWVGMGLIGKTLTNASSFIRGIEKLTALITPAAGGFMAFGAAIIGVYGVLDKAAANALLAETNFGTLDVTTESLVGHLSSMREELGGSSDALLKTRDEFAAMQETFGGELSGLMGWLFEGTYGGKKLSEEDAARRVRSLVDTINSEISTVSGGSMSYLTALLGDDPAVGAILSKTSGYYHGLYEQAQSIGEELRSQMVSALADGNLNEEEYEAIRATAQRLAEIESQIAADQAEDARYALLEKGMRISPDMYEAWSEEYNAYMNDTLAAMDEAYFEEAGRARRAGATEDELNAMYSAYLGKRNEAATRFMTDTDVVRNRFIDDNFAGLTDVNGNGLIPLIVQRLLYGEDGTLWDDVAGQQLYESLADDDTLTVDAINSILAQLIGQAIRQGGTYSVNGGTMTGDELLQMIALTGFKEGNLTGIHGYLRNGANGVELVASDHAYDNEEGFQYSSWYNGYEGLYMGATAEEAAQMQSDMGTVITQIQTESGFIQSISGTVGTISERLANGIPIAMGGLLGRIAGLFPKFAHGGRASTASIFGEAGAEWAIPESHTARTAALLNAAREASGFSWAEILSATGGLNAGSGGVLVFSPTVYASGDINSALIESEERLKKWVNDRDRQRSLVRF